MGACAPSLSVCSILRGVVSPVLGVVGVLGLVAVPLVCGHLYQRLPLYHHLRCGGVRDVYRQVCTFPPARSPLVPPTTRRPLDVIICDFCQQRIVSPAQVRNQVGEGDLDFSWMWIRVAAAVPELTESVWRDVGGPKDDHLFSLNGAYKKEDDTDMRACA